MTVSGKSADETGQAMKRLALALETGNADARTFTSLFLQFPELGRAVATGLNLSTGAFKQMLLAGQISTQDIVRGLQAAGQESSNLSTRFKNTEVTISQAFTTLRNAVERYIGQSDQASGVTRKLAEAIQFIATNANVTLPIIKAITVAITVLGVAMVVTSGAATAFFAALGANKWGLIIAGIAAAISLFVSFGDRIKLTADGSVTALGLVVGAIRLLGSGIEALVSLANVFFAALQAGNPVAQGLALVLTGVALAVAALRAVMIAQWVLSFVGALLSFAAAALGAAAAIAPVVLAVVGLAAAFAAGAVLTVKLTDALGITTGAYDRLEKQVTSFATTIKEKVGTAVTDASESLKKNALVTKDWAGDWGKAGNDVSGSAGKVKDSVNKMASDGQAALKAYGDAVANAQKNQQAFLKAMGDDVGAASIVINEAWQHAANDPDAGIKAYNQRLNETVTAQRNSMVALIEEQKKYEAAQKEAADKVIQEQDKVSQSTKSMSDNIGQALAASDGAYTKWATDAEAAIDKVIASENAAASQRAAQRQASQGTSTFSTTPGQVSFTAFQGTGTGRTLQAAGIDVGTLDSLLRAQSTSGGTGQEFAIDQQLRQFAQGYGEQQKALLRQLGLQFAGGGSFTVGGSGGTDTSLVQFMGTPGEVVNIEKPSSGGTTSKHSDTVRPITVQMTINTPDANSFRRNEQQLAMELIGKLRTAQNLLAK
jgi:tape measure domain-containing protein